MTNKIPEYIENAKFIKPETEVDENLWPRDPEKYEPTTKFIQRFREFGSIMGGDVIEDSIKYGEIYTASQNCVAFVNDLGGVAFYIIVAANYRDDKYKKAQEKNIADSLDKTSFYDYKAVTIWPFAYNRNKALDTGRWSTRQLTKIEELAHNENAEEHIGEYRTYIETENS